MVYYETVKEFFMIKSRIGTCFFLVVVGYTMVEVKAAAPYGMRRFFGAERKEYDPAKAQDIFERYVATQGVGADPKRDIHRAKKFALTELPGSLRRLRQAKRRDPATFEDVLALERNKLLTWESLFTAPEYVPDELFVYWRELIDHVARE